MLLKHQLIIHNRSRQRAPNLTAQDRALLGFWSLFLDPRRVARSAIIIKPSTLLRFQSAIKKRKYRLLYSSGGRRKPGPKGPSKEVICESIILKSHWVLLVMDQHTRQVVGFAVHAGYVHGPTLCSMFNKATSGHGWPRYLSSDNDPLFQYHRWKANLRVLEIEEIKSVPHVPMSHPFVERLIGSVRRELLDHTFFWTATDLENKLRNYQRYYNEHRTHSRRDGATPVEPGVNKIVDITNYR